jgi:hypothetical protein
MVAGIKMDIELQEECVKLICKYQKYKSNTHKQKVRNEIYEKMMTWMLIWVKSILTKWGKTESSTEKISMSWDAFMFCIDRYKEGYPLAKHFHEYTKYYLLIKYAKEARVTLPLEELKETLLLVETPENVLFDRLLTLQQFRDVIPDKYKIVWDDACQSLSDADQYRQNTKNPGIDRNVYVKLKEGYIPIIELILGTK